MSSPVLLPPASLPRFGPVQRRRAITAGVCDVVCVIAFAVAGRSSHAHGVGVVGVLHTAWPFLAGAAIGWVVARAWRSPVRLWPTTTIVWACAWGAGMVLRGVTGGGLAPSFLVVAAVVLAVLLFGWRLLTRAVLRAGELQQD